MLHFEAAGGAANDGNEAVRGLSEPRAFYFDDVPIARATMEEAVEAVVLEATGGGAECYRFVNAYTLALASGDAEYKNLLQGTGVNLPDGLPLAGVLTRVGQGACHQVRGPSFFEGVLDAGRTQHCRHFLLGSTAETLTFLERAIETRFPGADVVGSFSPPFGALTREDRAQHSTIIKDANPHIVWVGMGTPRQDFEARRIVDELGVTAIGVGAAFDFTAGTKRQAPALLRRFGLEWLFRLVSEPRRLGRRYLVGNSVFARLALRELRRR